MDTKVKTVIREAKPSDLDEVAVMIRELAEFEKVYGDPVITAEGLFKSCGFSNDQQQSSTDPAEIIILVAEAENAKALVGYTVLMPGYSARSGRTLLMKNMYVRESHRAIGVGSAIFRGIARYGLQHGYAFEENHVFSWNKPAVKFYERMGAEDLSASEGAQYLRVELDQSKK